MICYSPFGWYSDRSPVTFISAQPCDDVSTCSRPHKIQFPNSKLTILIHAIEKQNRCVGVCVCVCELQQEEPSMNRTCSKFQKSLLSLIVLTKFNNNKNIYDFLLTSTVVWSAETSPRLFEKIIVVLKFCHTASKDARKQYCKKTTWLRMCKYVKISRQVWTQ